MNDDIPRRNRLDQMSPAERAIYDVTQVVEGVGAHPLLSEAVILLGKAREKVADFVDQDPPTLLPCPWCGRHPQFNGGTVCGVPSVCVGCFFDDCPLADCTTPEFPTRYEAAVAWNRRAPAHPATGEERGK